jgi:hypothetical protein
MGRVLDTFQKFILGTYHDVAPVDLTQSATGPTLKHLLEIFSAHGSDSDWGFSGVAIGAGVWLEANVAL